MEAAGGSIAIRLPLALVCVVVFMCIWCGVLLAGFIAAAVHGSPVVAVPLFMLALGLALAVRTYRISVILGAHDLLVRNYFRTRRVARRDIEGFRVGAMSLQPFMRTVYVLLGDGTVLPLDVTGRPYFRGRRKATPERQTRALQTWLDGD